MRDRLAYIDALRGYAILGVIGVHSSQLFPNLEWPVKVFLDQGARGVQLFFVVSALTLMLSWQSRADGPLRFWIRRAFRIVPMFWLALIYYVVLVGVFHVRLHWGPTEITWRDALASGAILHGFHPETINSIVPGGWSIADEAEFYALFPLLLLFIRSWQAAAVALLLSTILIFVSLPFMPADEEFVLLLPFQLPAFLVGILLFYLLRDFSGRLSPKTICAGLCCAFALAIALPFLAATLAERINWAVYLFFLGNLPMSYAAIFGAVVFALAEGVGLLLVNATIRRVGKVSYSAYFWHFAILELAARFVDASGGWLSFSATFAIVALLSVAGATLTFHLIEEPMIRVGRGLASHLFAPPRRPFAQTDPVHPTTEKVLPS